MPCLYTLRVLGRIRKREQLLLKLGGNVDTCEVGSLCTHAYFLTGLVSEEDALLGVLRIVLLSRVHSRDATCTAIRRVYREGSVDVTPCLIKLDSLPSIFGRLADAIAFDSLLVLGGVALQILVVNVSLDLILAKSQRQVQFKGSLVALA